MGYSKNSAFMIRNFGKKPLSLLGFDHQIRNYVTVFSKLEKNLNEFWNSLNERCIYEIHSIEVQNLLFTNFNASIYTKKIGNAIKKHALLLRYNNCDYLMPSLSELKVSWTGITARSTEWFISNRSIRLNDF